MDKRGREEIPSRRQVEYQSHTDRATSAKDDPSPKPVGWQKTKRPRWNRNQQKLEAALLSYCKVQRAQYCGKKRYPKVVCCKETTWEHRH